MFHCLVNVAVRLIGAVRILRTGLRLFGVRALLAALLLIQLAEDGVHLLGEGIHRVLDFFRVVALAHLLEVRDSLSTVALSSADSLSPFSRSCFSIS